MVAKVLVETEDIDEELSESRIPIKVGKQDYFITSDSRQWICGYLVQQKQKDGSYKERLQGKWYCSSLSSLFSILLEKKLRLSDYQSFDDLQRNLAKVREELQGMYDTTIVKAKGYRP